MHFNVVLKKILVIIGLLKATTMINNDKELEEFLITSRNSKETICQICYGTLFNNNPNDIKEIESSLESFMVNHSLLFCPSSSKHIFHKMCLIQWFFSSNSCPVCRSTFSSDLFEKHIFDMWHNFYSLDKNTQNELISQLKHMNILYLTKVFRIFKYDFGRNKLENLKSLFPKDDHRKRLIRILNAYKKHKNITDSLFISNYLTNESLSVLKEIFKPDDVSKLLPIDLLKMCKNLDAHCINNGIGNSIFDFLNIKKMEKYDEKFSFDDLIKILREEIEVEGDFWFVKDICIRMHPQNPFDEKIIIEYLYETINNNGSFNAVYGFEFLSCIINFYKLEEIEFCRRLVTFIINNRKISGKNDKKYDLKSVFDFIFRSFHEDELFDITKLLDSIICSKEDFNEKSRDNLVELLLILFNEEIKETKEDYDVSMEENESDEDVSMEESQSNYDVSMRENAYNDEFTDLDGNNESNLNVVDANANNLLQSDSNIEEQNSASFEENVEIEDEQEENRNKGFENILEYVINNYVMGDKFLEIFRKNYDSVNIKFKAQVEYYEDKMLKSVFKSLQSFD